MIATLTTAAFLLVPLLGVVVAGALAVAIHDAIARLWAARRGAQDAVAGRGAAWRRGAPGTLGPRGARALRVHHGAAARRHVRRGPAVLVR
jgi:hypothetical protein